jgi:hypothetical protein
MAAGFAGFYVVISVRSLGGGSLVFLPALSMFF